MTSRPGGNAWLAVRSVVWTVAFPGTFAGYVPWRFFGLRDVRLDPSNPGQLLGIALMVAGAALLFSCIWHFASSGRGTLSPVDPPTTLVVRGPYRFVRNPMYLGVTTVVFGELLLTRSVGLLVFWAVWFGFVNLFVMGYEEPTLRRQFGESYEAYTREVGRWLPTFARGHSGGGR